MSESPPAKGEEHGPPPETLDQGQPIDDDTAALGN